MQQQQQQAGRPGRRREFETIEVRAPRAVIDAYRERARANERSIAGEIRFALKTHLERPEEASHGA